MQEGCTKMFQDVIDYNLYAPYIYPLANGFNKVARFLYEDLGEMNGIFNFGRENTTHTSMLCS